MSALLNQIDELLSVHNAAFSYGHKGYMVAVGNRIFEDKSLKLVVSDAWTHVCQKEFTNA